MVPEPSLTAEPNSTLQALLRPSTLVLILANLIPLYGVIVLDWKIFPLVFLFWLENLIIGAFCLLRILVADPGNKTFWLLKVFLIPFFCVHFGLFTFVHGVFVMGLFGGMFRTGAPFPGEDVVVGFIHQYQLGVPILGLALSHAVSFAVNFIREGEYRRANPMGLMQQPYGRVVVLHVTLLFGGFLVMAFQSPVTGLLLLIVLKIGLDLRSHIREHKFGATLTK